MSTITDQLIQLSHDLGKEERKYSILGEGNTSARLDDDHFLVKASGCQLHNLREDQLANVAFAPILEALDSDDLSDAYIKGVFESCSSDGPRPSIETFMHAACLTIGQANCVGHTHTESILKILCSKAGSKPFLQQIYPDVIVVCGRHILALPYINPGIMLAIQIKEGLELFMDQHGHPPKLILLENHGPVALGANPAEVFNIMQMADKWAQVLVGTQAFGGPNYMPEAEADKIDGRSDEDYRRKQLLG